MTAAQLLNGFLKNRILCRRKACSHVHIDLQEPATLHRENAVQGKGQRVVQSCPSVCSHMSMRQGLLALTPGALWMDVCVHMGMSV